MYSYDRTSAVLPLVIAKDKVVRWVNDLRKRQGKRVKDLLIFKGRSDQHIETSVNFDDGTNERFDIELQFNWKGGALEISPHFRGLRVP